jgi:hypothetical protein
MVILEVNMKITNTDSNLAKKINDVESKAMASSSIKNTSAHLFEKNPITAASGTEKTALDDAHPSSQSSDWFGKKEGVKLCRNPLPPGVKIIKTDRAY